MADAQIFSQRFPRNENKNDPYQILIQQNKEGAGQEDRLVQIHGFLPEQITFDVSAQYEAPYAQGINGAIPLFGSLARSLGVNLVTQAMTAQVWQGSTEINFQIPIVFQAENDAYLEVIKPIKELLKLTMPLDPNNGGLLEAPGPHIDLDKFQSSVNAVFNTTTPGPQQEISGNKFVDSILGGAQGIGDTIIGFGKNLIGQGQEVLGDVDKAGTFSAFAKLGVKGVKALRDSSNKGAVAFNRTLVNSIVNNISLYVGDFLYFPSVVITDVSQAYDILIAPDNNPYRATVNVTFKTFYIPTQADLDVMFQNRDQPSNDQSGLTPDAIRFGGGSV